MDKARFGRSVEVLAEATGRRNALRSLGAAGVALLAALGLSGEAAAKKDGGGKGHRQKKQQKNRAQATRTATPSGGGGAVEAEANDKKAGPTGPTGPTGPNGLVGPQGEIGAAGEPGVQGGTGSTGAAGPTGEPGTSCTPRAPILRKGAFETGIHSGLLASLVNCAASEHAVNGGYHFFLDTNRPGNLKWVSHHAEGGNGGKPEGWSAVGEITGAGPGTRWQFQAWVLCVPD